MRSLVLHDGTAKYAFLQAAKQALGADQIDFASAEQLRKLLLDRDDLPPRGAAGLELDQHVDIAVRTEVIAQYGSKQREPPDAVPPTECGQRLAWYGQVAAYHDCGPRITRSIP